ncbi:MAG: ShlB/FhaC/HecB family hemolysin secretion/activation protein [Methylococcus sp.]
MFSQSLRMTGLMLVSISSLAIATETVSQSSRESTTFDVWEYQIQGNSVLENRTIEQTVYKFLGPGKSLTDVEEARTALEKAYHQAGYQAALVDIPEQDVKEGVVILKVQEGNVDRMRVTGAQYFSPNHIKESVPAMAEGKPLNLPQAQKELTKLAGENPDRQVTPVMRAGSTPGTIDVDLEVKDELPLHGSMELNARNSINTTRLRLPVMLRYDNLWQLNHSASLQYQVSPEDPSNVQVWSGTYVLPIEAIDSRLALYGIGLDSSSDVTTAGAMNVVGNGNIFGMRLSKPIGETRSLMQSVTLGWDYKDFGQSINPLGDGTGMSDSSPVSYSPFQLGYSASLYQEGGSLTQFNSELNFNIAGMGSSYEQFAKRRYGATPNYLYLAGEVKHRQALPEDVALQFRVSGQVANEPLISNEQMGAGGMLTVRGYHEVERLGDNGVIGSMELWSPDFGDYGFEGVESLNDFRMLAFTDAAQLWMIDPLPGTPETYDLFSTGAGFRMRAFHHVLGEFYWEYPFVATEFVKAGQQRIDFRVAYEF